MSPTLRKARLRHALSELGFFCTLIDWAWEPFDPTSLIFNWRVECPREFA